MCTVSYIPFKNGNKFVLTSNRDEKAQRATIAPEIYNINDISVCFPKDIIAGGTWIAMNDQGRIAVLLNGAFKAHIKKDFHTYSRGKVLLQLLTTKNDALKYFDAQTLINAEPFTIITIDQVNGKIEDLSEFIWDGKDKHYRELVIEQEYIWSSSTLYSEEIRKKRRQWFNKFIVQTRGIINQKLIYNFHTGKHTYDRTNNLVMERDDELKTVSVTQIYNDEKGLIMSYTDLINNTVQQQRI